ncbi:hypothetical protein P0C22_15375 [Plesiomonas shigelloides]|uniref:hypothetical protein n=1 Tax=Plesiomonas shigelloides TaxID=703 RepID=UPI0030BA9C23
MKLAACGVACVFQSIFPVRFLLIYLARPIFKAIKLIGDISKLKLLLQDNSIGQTTGVHRDG